MNAVDMYFNSIKEKLEKVLDTQRENIEKVANIFAEGIENKKTIFVFGTSHGGMITEELYYRAGGLAVINPIFNPALVLSVRPITMTSQFERLEGQSQALLDSSKAKSGDIILIHSVSGRNSSIVEMALAAKEKGLTVIGLTNLNTSTNSKSRHESGKRLFEICDIYIDNCGDIGDASIKFDGLEQKAGATSTVIGATIVNSISVRTVELLLEKGIEPPIFYSANIDGGDEKNQKIFEEYKDNIHYM